jgi:hypothetical protein
LSIRHSSLSSAPCSGSAPSCQSSPTPTLGRVQQQLLFRSLTTSTFEILKADSSIGRAEALRRAMLAYLNDPSDPMNTYPAN